ncbi:hypothetical protein G8E10_24775 [Rhizobiaceae bacterium CRRU44]|uniref:Uncharacterized protein n=1 Tax=Ferranicluibacter rubi TaxID=2715133 RepID=A0AA44CF79_9HYPH|nr:hypothetical protein [Ferranicluibacter rubi]NHT78917.1 hypothetical protein [Ferranicluibacter rubi]
MSNNPASSAAMQLGGIFTALVGSMPLESTLAAPARHGYSQGDMNAVVNEANKRIRVLNDRVRRLKADGTKAVRALNDTVMAQAELIIELETRLRLTQETMEEMERSALPRPSPRFEIEAVAMAPVVRR